ncbi:T9SS type A sorting domain-containing protein [candidate division WOR-3 bacterium]|nr:T9SS type A sorting domain-containing protein [candidate division WOR-3 bacterium]
MKNRVILSIAAVLTCGLQAATLRLTAPEVRSYACMIHDAAHNRMILFSGGSYRMYDGRVFNDTWAFNITDETWSKLSPSGTAPAERIMAAAAYDNTGNRMIVFGGGGELGPQYNDVWALNLSLGVEAWSQLSTSGTPPSPRTSATAMVDEYNNRLIVFGGEAGAGGMNTTYSLDLSTLIWSQLFPSGTAPCPRFEHSAVYDPIGHRMIIFGGRNDVHMNDTWTLNLSAGAESWQQLFPTGNPPNARGRHFCAYDHTNENMIIGLGYAYTGYYVLYSDIWKLDIDQQAWQQISYAGGIIPGRRGTVAAYSAPCQEVVLFGGDQPYASYFGETCILSLDNLAVAESSEQTVAARPSMTISGNPSRSPLHINVFLPKADNACLKIHDLTGRVVRTLFSDVASTGNYILQWDGTDQSNRRVPAGTYFLRLHIDGTPVTEKAVLVH